MRSFEIYWDDLTEEAKERLTPIYNENDWIPIAIVNIDDEVDYDLLLNEED